MSFIDTTEWFKRQAAKIRQIMNKREVCGHGNVSFMGDKSGYYEILGLDSDATLQDVKQAYRDLVRVWHPDRFQHDPRLQKKAQEKLKQINKAYEALCSTLKTSTSDTSIHENYTKKDKHEYREDAGESEYYESQSESTKTPFKTIHGFKSLATFIAFALIVILIFAYYKEVLKIVSN